MQESAMVAYAQRDDPTLTPADLISAYEQGVEELRLAVAGSSQPRFGRKREEAVATP